MSKFQTLKELYKKLNLLKIYKIINSCETQKESYTLFRYILTLIPFIIPDGVSTYESEYLGQTAKRYRLKRKEVSLLVKSYTDKYSLSTKINGKCIDLMPTLLKYYVLYDYDNHCPQTCYDIIMELICERIHYSEEIDSNQLQNYISIESMSKKNDMSLCIFMFFLITDISAIVPPDSLASNIETYAPIIGSTLIFKTSIFSDETINEFPDKKLIHRYDEEITHGDSYFTIVSAFEHGKEIEFKKIEPIYIIGGEIIHKEFVFLMFESDTYDKLTIKRYEPRNIKWCKERKIYVFSEPVRCYRHMTIEDREKLALNKPTILPIMKTYFKIYFHFKKCKMIQS
jgi:hypothetical protein